MNEKLKEVHGEGVFEGCACKWSNVAVSVLILNI